MVRKDKKVMAEVAGYMSHQLGSRAAIETLSLGAQAVLSSEIAEEPSMYQEDIAQRTGARGTGGGVAASETNVALAMAGVLAAIAAPAVCGFVSCFLGTPFWCMNDYIAYFRGHSIIRNRWPPRPGT